MGDDGDVGAGVLHAETAERPLRAAGFDALFATVTGPAERLGPTRLRVHLPGGPDADARARDLIARETACSFLSFDLGPSATATGLDIRVPESQVTVLDALQQRVEAARAGVSIWRPGSADRHLGGA